MLHVDMWTLWTQIGAMMMPVVSYECEAGGGGGGCGGSNVGLLYVEDWAVGRLCGLGGG